MESIKSSDYIEIITTLLCDVQTLHSSVFTDRARRLTTDKVVSRVGAEGIGFLTKTLPSLGKALDSALSDRAPLDAAKLAFKSKPGSQLPIFMGELFERVLDHNGVVLPQADVQCIITLRSLLYSMYKLKFPNDPKQEYTVIQKFIKTDEDLRTWSVYLSSIADGIHRNGCARYLRDSNVPYWYQRTIRNSRRLLLELFDGFDWTDIYPRHGPGAVSTGERLWDKYRWTNVPSRITQSYPLDSYYYVSPGHCCDSLKDILSLGSVESYAKVILVPKDSRGPRLISCEPLEFQWIQQGLGRAIVRHVERHPLSRWSVRFTDQQPNRLGALVGSQTGKYATLDLAEASDRVSVGLVNLLFQGPLLEALNNCRSLGTTLPDQKEIQLHKFAPMGSALCFPILALTVWSLLVSGLRVVDANVLNEDVYVYGDDVIVPAHLAEHAMNILESFGLKVNRDKSCTKGFFRESCGLDAYKGVDVTPVRFRTPWSSLRRPEVYASWMAYANHLHRRKYYKTYELIVERLLRVYDSVPLDVHLLKVPSLPYVPDSYQAPRRRWNPNLQKLEYLVNVVEPVKRDKEIDGWAMLLRYFSEANSSYELYRSHHSAGAPHEQSLMTAFSVRAYTLQRRSKLRRRWR